MTGLKERKRNSRRARVAEITERRESWQSIRETSKELPKKQEAVIEYVMRKLLIRSEKPFRVTENRITLRPQNRPLQIGLLMECRGILNDIRDNRVYVSVITQRNEERDLVFPLDVMAKSSQPKKGDRIVYKISRDNSGELAHVIDIVPPLPIGSHELRDMDEEIEKFVKQLGAKDGAA